MKIHLRKLLALLLALLTLLPLCAVGLPALADEDAADGASYDDVDPNDKDNIAYHKPTRANVNNSFPECTVDGDLSTIWSGVDYPKYVDVDLMANYDLTKIVVYMPTATKNAYQFAVYGSLDGVTFTRLYKSELKKPAKEGETIDFDTPVNYRVIRVNVLANSAGSSKPSQIAEIKAYGTKNESEVVPTREKMEFTSYEQWLAAREEGALEGVAVKDGNFDIDATYDETDTIDALRGLVTRMLGSQYLDWFTFAIAGNPTGSGYDYFTLETADGKVKITGNEGVSCAVGLNHYLKYFCFVDISQQTSNVKDMPESAPEVGEKVFRETPLEVRYAYNYCTLSYTMAFFGYDDWQRELDYLMLSGVNLILDTTATEALWVAYLQHYGYSAYEALDYVCGYAYKAWWLMGNLYGYGGNVSDQWVYDTLEMARVNQRYMTVMGAEPCLQAFVGTLPTNFAAMAADTLTGMGFSDPKDFITGTGGWIGFVRPYVLNTTYDGYAAMAADFYAVQQELYGPVTDYYAGDFFHEIEGNPPASFNKAAMSADTLKALMKADPDGVWILQAWWSNPLPEVLEGFGNYRADHIIVLDLGSNDTPKWNNTTTWGGKEFGGTGWVYSMLDNFGGRTGVHGNLEKTAKNIYKALTTTEHMKGIGITPEGTQQNPVVFELYWEAVWQSEQINVDEWIVSYAERRYGKGHENAVKAWQSLADNYNVYETNTADGSGVNYAINNNPSFAPGANEGGYFEAAFRMPKLEQAITLLMEDFDELCGNENYVDDLVDLFRLELSERSTDLISKMKKAVQDQDYAAFVAYGDKLMGAMALIDEIASYQKDELFGSWIGRTDTWMNDERTGKYDDYAADMLHINAKALVTMWASAPIVNYAYRQYSGLMSDYYTTMWRELNNQVKTALTRGTTVSNSVLALDGGRCFELAWEIVTSDKQYPTEVSPAAGGENARGLKAIFDEIKNGYYTSAKIKILPAAISFAEGSAFTVTGKRIDNVVSGTTAGELLAAMNEHLGTVKITSEGKELAEGDPLVENATLRLENEDGKQIQKYTVGKLLYTGEQLEGIRTELTAFLAEMEKKIPSEECAESVAAAIAAVNDGLAAGITNENADTLLETVKTTRETGSFTDKPTFPVIPVAVGGGVIVLAAAVVGIVVGSKKKKSKAE